MKKFFKNILQKIAVYLIKRCIVASIDQKYAATASLRPLQTQFAKELACLIEFAHSLPGYELTMGECWRPEEMQALYLADGRSKVRRSLHQDRLAVDINVFINGVWRTDREAFKPLANYWKSLDPEKNVSGYDWNWDYNHFQKSK